MSEIDDEIKSILHKLNMGSLLESIGDTSQLGTSKAREEQDMKPIEHDPHPVENDCIRRLSEGNSEISICPSQESFERKSSEQDLPQNESTDSSEDSSNGSKTHISQQDGAVSEKRKPLSFLSKAMMSTSVGAFLAVSGFAFYSYMLVEQSPAKMPPVRALVYVTVSEAFDKSKNDDSRSVRMEDMNLVAFSDQAPGQFENAAQNLELSQEANRQFAQFSQQLQSMLDERVLVLEQRKADIVGCLDAEINFKQKNDAKTLSSVRRFQAADILLSYNIALFIDRSRDRLVKNLSIPNSLVHEELLKLSADNFDYTLLEQMQRFSEKWEDIKQSIDLVNEGDDLSEIAEAAVHAQKCLDAFGQDSFASALVDVDQQKMRLRKISSEAVEKLFVARTTNSTITSPHQEDVKALAILSTIVPATTIQRWNNWVAAFSQDPQKNEQGAGMKSIEVEKLVSSSFDTKVTKALPPPYNISVDIADASGEYQADDDDDYSDDYDDDFDPAAEW